MDYAVRTFHSDFSVNKLQIATASVLILCIEKQL